MKWRFWRKTIPTTPENCDHMGVGVRMLNPWIKVPLKDGHHTAFAVMKCERCGAMVGFPGANLTLALQEGTGVVKDQLRVLAERVLALPIAT